MDINVVVKDKTEKTDYLLKDNKADSTSDFRSPIKALAKMKRFLSEITYKANELPNDAINIVKKLIMDLVNGDISSEQFYDQLSNLISLPEKIQSISLISESLPLFQNELNHIDLIHDYKPNNLNILVEASRQLKSNEECQSSNSYILNFQNKKANEKVDQTENNRIYSINNLAENKKQLPNVSTINSSSFMQNSLPILPDTSFLINSTNEILKISQETVLKLQLLLHNLQKKYNKDVHDIIEWYKGTFDKMELTLNQKYAMALRETSKEHENVMNELLKRQKNLLRQLFILNNNCKCSNKIPINHLICWNCGKAASIACKLCHTAVYCDDQCLAENWNNHVNDCLPITNQPNDCCALSSSFHNPGRD